MSWSMPELAPPFASHTPESFLAHVGTLKRIPKKTSASKRVPKLARLVAKLQAKARVLELSSGSLMYPLNFTVTKVERKALKHATRVEILNAARVLLQPEGAIVALLEKKKIIPEAPLCL